MLKLNSYSKIRYNGCLVIQYANKENAKKNTYK